MELIKIISDTSLNHFHCLWGHCVKTANYDLSPTYLCTTVCINIDIKPCCFNIPVGKPKHKVLLAFF